MRVRVIGCLLHWTRNAPSARLGVGREHAMEANQIRPREAGRVRPAAA